MAESGGVSSLVPVWVWVNAHVWPVNIADQNTSVLILADTTNILADTADIASIKTQTDKLAGMPGTNGALTRNWNAAEATLCTIGAPNTRYKVHNLMVGIHNLVGNIMIRLYIDVGGAERCIYPIPAATTFNVAVDQVGIPVIDSTFGIRNALRVTLQSDAAADDGKSVEYDYLIEAF